MAPDERPPQLQPPPRVRPRADGGETFRSRRPGGIGIALLSATLILALIGVFVVLPHWAATRPTTAERDVPVDGGVIKSEDAASSLPNPEPTAVDSAELVAAPITPPHATPTRHGEQARPTPPPSTSPNEPAFVAAMSSGLLALENGDWDAAREAFETASSLRPAAPEVADGLARTAAAERRALVNTGTVRGLELEASEDWAEAEKTYLQVLAVEPEAADAIEGRDRAARRAALDERLQYHIANPGRLASPGVFEDATELLAEARELDPRGPRLEAQLSRLEESLETASTPVPVVVVSDNLTQVAIYRVDRLGTFSKRELRLRPGTYTAVGSRDGFRDVRVQFTVTAGAAPAAVTVVCTEQL